MQNIFRLFRSENMDGEFPALQISILSVYQCSGLPRAFRLNTATLISEKDARSISIRLAVVESLIERTLFVFQNVASFLDDEDIPS